MSENLKENKKLKSKTKKNAKIKEKSQKKGMFEEIESYGYHYSFKNFFIRLLMVWGIMGVAAYFYSLKIIPIIILAILCKIGRASCRERV